MANQSMSSTRPNSKTLQSGSIDRLLSRIRYRTRSQIAIEGLSTATSFALASLSIALLLDYVPVTFGYDELSRPVRGLILVLASLVTGWIVYIKILRRLFVPLKSQSLALLVERSYPRFNDSLITTVESMVPGTGRIADAEMLKQTQATAESLLSDVEISKIVDRRPLMFALGTMLALVVSVVALAAAKPGFIRLAGKRLILLDDTLWPRSSNIELVGIKIKREVPVEGIPEIGQIIPPDRNRFYIAKGGSLTLLIRAEDETQAEDRMLPETCSLRYETEDGDRGTKKLSKIGSPRNGYQAFELDGVPFRGLLSNVKFSVRGGDHRIGPFHVEIVPSPDIVTTKLACQFPKYLADENSSRWSDRTIDWVGQTNLPQGTQISILAEANKPLEKIYVFDLEKKTTAELFPYRSKSRPDCRQFQLDLPPLESTVNLELYLCDQDGLIGESPHSITLDPILDQPPQIQSKLFGIGTAVTPDVRIPFVGTIRDDYGLAQTWLEIQTDDSEAVTEPISVSSDGYVSLDIDFKRRRQEKGSAYDLKPGGDHTVSLVAKSKDHFNLQEQSNIGTGDEFTLDIVSVDELLRLLEQLEVGQRQRLEQIYLEMMEAKSYLTRAKNNGSATLDLLIEPGDQSARPSPGALRDSIPPHELGHLFVLRTITQIDKSTQEILGCAQAFESIRLQLVNNRIDSEDRKKRISQQIITPLNLLADQSMQQLKEKVIALEKKLRSELKNRSQKNDQQNLMAREAIQQTDLVLTELDRILGVLVKYETQNELLDIVRKMIATQKQIMERTKQERQRQAFDGLLD